MAGQNFKERVGSVQTAEPTTGQTVVIINTDSAIINLSINPLGTLAALTVNMPSSPTTGQRVNITSTQIITALTLAVGTITGAITSLVANAFASYLYDGTAWRRIG